MITKNTKSLLTFGAILLVASMLMTPFVAKSKKTSYSFEITMPEEVRANPGQTVTVEGEILVTGFFWLHNFELSADGLPYDYTIDPEWWEHVRILRDWNSEDGIVYVPEKFEMEIQVPSDATGSHIVTVTGQEHHSFREISNYTFFILKVGDEPLEPQVQIADLLVPEKVDPEVPFKMTYRLSNEGPVDVQATVTPIMPDDWQIDKAEHTVTVGKGEDASGVFEITPTLTPGPVSLRLEYEIAGESFTSTKSGPYMVPTGATTTTTTGEESKPLLVQIREYLDNAFGSTTGMFGGIENVYVRSAIIGAIFVLVLIIIWLIVDIIRFTTKESKEEEGDKKKEPEKTKESKKMAEPVDETADVSMDADLGITKL